jgi:hypothetical protein
VNCIGPENVLIGQVVLSVPRGMSYVQVIGNILR